MSLPPFSIVLIQELPPIWSGTLPGVVFTFGCDTHRPFLRLISHSNYSLWCILRFLFKRTFYLNNFLYNRIKVISFLAPDYFWKGSLQISFQKSFVVSVLRWPRYTHSPFSKGNSTWVFILILMHHMGYSWVSSWNMGTIPFFWLSKWPNSSQGDGRTGL